MSEEKQQRESHVKSLRLLKLEKAIQSIPYPSVERLKKELEVSRRTILRDIDELKIYYNAPIEYDRLKKGYYYTDETFFVKNVLVSEGELVAMAGILPLLERYDNTPFKETINKVYDTISQMLPNQIQETLFWVLHFGSAVKILNPPELKQMYKEEIEKMSKNI